MLIEPPKFTSCVLCLDPDVPAEGLITVGGAFVKLAFQSYPTQPFQMFIYIETIGGRGEVLMGWRVIHASEDAAPILEWKTRARYRGPLLLDHRIWQFPPMVFPAAGEYLVQAWHYKEGQAEDWKTPRETLIDKHFTLELAG